MSNSPIVSSAHRPARRSTRLSEAVLMRVEGVDSYRGPYSEEVSTVSVSAHGCKYYSKHQVLSNALVYALVSSRIGRALRAIKLNEPLAQSQRVNPVSYRLLAVVLSAFLAGAIGGMFVFYLGMVDPTIFDFYYTETMLIMVVIGGPGSFWWVLASTAILTVLPDALEIAPDLRMVLYGALLVAAMLALPGGIGGWFAARRLARWRKRPYGSNTQPV